MINPRRGWSNYQENRALSRRYLGNSSGAQPSGRWQSDSIFLCGPDRSSASPSLSIWLLSRPASSDGLRWPLSHRQASGRSPSTRPLNRLQTTENGLLRNDVSPGVDLRLRACLAILEAADAMRADTICPTPGRGDKASIDRRVLQTGALQGIIRISMRAEACASTAFAVSHDYAGPDWLWG